MEDKQDAFNLTDGVLLKSSDNSLALKPSIPVFYGIIKDWFGDNKRNDNRNMMRFNVMECRREWYDPKEQKWKEWTDADLSKIRALIQANYGLHNVSMLDDALNIWFDALKANPLLEILDNLEWDGVPRIENFLTDVMKAPDTPYTRECSRLIFSGGVHRAYEPGCQFDDVVVLVGEQGNGKSTIVRWLNIEDNYHRDVKRISGKEAVEDIMGGWICEVAELLAVTQSRDAEAVKAFITSRSDRYRVPYAKNPITLPRRCCFIGTTNKQMFLFDKTGNRRFYPVHCNISPYELHDHEKEIREYISQAWAEAVYLYKKGQLLPYARRELRQDILIEQENALEDDWRTGKIQQYMESRNTVCVIEVWHDALGMDRWVKPTKKDSNEIAQIILSVPGWERSKKPEYTSLYGKQKVFKRQSQT